ncbi:MAG: hypothetical protein U9O89_02565 [Thermoproteota archaeon]|nr:hypothetical protein [Thermoproteota archaeon]
MGLRLLLVKDDEVLYEIPLLMEDWQRERLDDELKALEQEFDNFSMIFDALSNKSRLRMMKRLFEDNDLTLGFTDFMKDLRLNPKTVWEGTKKLCRGGLLEKSNDGKYRCSELGQAEFLMISLLLRHLLHTFRELEEW